MTRARDIADLVDANGDIVAGALDNVPAADLVNDTTPQLGGDLDGQTNNITNVGKIGIGTASSSHSAKLTVQGAGGADGDVRVQIHNSGTGASDDSIFRLSIGGATASNFVQFGDSADANAGQIEYDHNDNSMRFTTNAVERLTIQNGGGLDGTCLYATFTEYTGNMNDLKRTGFYRSYSGNSNNPTSAYYSVVVYGNQGNVTAQIATKLGSTQTYVRSFNTSWTSWQRLDT